MGKCCERTGCRKYARRPSPFCRNHKGNAKETVEVKGVAVTAEKLTPTKKKGYFGTFDLKDEKTLEEITTKMNNHSNDFEENSNLMTGGRVMANLDNVKMEDIRPLLDLIMEEARDRIKFPLKKTRLVRASLVIAPASSNRSNSWTTGQIHRDFSDVDMSGVYVFYLCIDEITEHNGAITFWPESKTCPVSTKTPRRFIKNMQSTTLLGPRGTMFVWDARLLHQSLPNKTAGARKALVWLVNSVTNPDIIILP
jgi:ectoine hydroxylase-related dioxygenase (phytanoyl-CoA dioxygenase family)